MSNHLQNRNGTYYFRRVVPDDVRGHFRTANGKPRTEWTWSLRVKDRETAKRLLPECLARTNTLIDRARKAPPPSRLAGQENREASAIERAMLEDSLEAADFFAGLYAEEEDRAARDPAFAADQRLLALRAKEANEISARLEDKKLLAELRVENAESITGLYEKWAGVAGRNPKTVRQWRPYISNLATFLGHDNALDVREADLVAWRNQLRDGDGKRAKSLAPKTINGSYLGAVSALFAWAKNDGLIPTNPAKDVAKVQVIRRPSLRTKEFTMDEARLILNATLVVHQTTAREREELRTAKRWVPWLMAYSGARVNEITQLRKQDIVVQDGINVMRLTPDAGTIKAKQARVVPLHSHLVDMGFLDFVAEKEAGPLFFDPKRRRSEDAINRQASRLGSKLASWVRSLGLTDRELKPNHAWRHLFNTLALRHEIEGRVARAILGHAAGNVNESYGSVPVDVMAAQIERLPRFL